MVQNVCSSTLVRTRSCFCTVLIKGHVIFNLSSSILSNPMLGCGPSFVTVSSAIFFFFLFVEVGRTIFFILFFLIYFFIFFFPCSFFKFSFFVSFIFPLFHAFEFQV